MSDEELFHPDCRDLADAFERAEGTEVECVVGERMIHDWILMPVPEAGAAIDRIGAFLAREGTRSS